MRKHVEGCFLREDEEKMLTSEEKITLSIIIPVYNCERYIARCLESILFQRESDIEIICVDDCSDDDSLCILKKYAAEHENIRVYSNTERLWQGECRNIGLRKARGEYVWFVDGDDIVPSGALRVVFDSTGNSKADTYLFNAWKRMETTGERTVGPYTLKEKTSNSGIAVYKMMITAGCEDHGVWRRVFRRAFLLDNELFFSGGDPHEDVLFSIRTMITAERAVASDGYIYEYVSRNSSSSKSAEYASKRIWSLCYVIAELFDLYYTGEDLELKKYFLKEIQSISQLLADKIRKIDQIDRCGMMDEDPRMLYFGMCASALYGGSFSLLLSPGQMLKIRDAKKLMIYGAGDEGKGLLRLLSDRNIKVCCFVTSDEPREKKVCGVPVRCVCKLDVRSGDLILLAVKNSLSEDEMRKNAKEQGFLDVQIMAV